MTRPSTICLLIRRDGPNCHYCGRLVTRVTWSKDHIVPQALSGPTVLSNLVLACRKCNSDFEDQLHKCACAFCLQAEATWMEWCLEMTETKLRSEADRVAMFRAVWSKREDNKGKQGW